MIQLPFDGIINDLARSYAGEALNTSRWVEEERCQDLLRLLDFMEFLDGDARSTEFDGWEVQEELSIDALPSIATHSFDLIEQRSQNFDGHRIDYQLRPYPSAGAAHELELFCLLGDALNSQFQVFHFDPLECAFTQLVAPPRVVQKLLDNMGRCWQQTTPPRAAFIIATRHQRIAFRYTGIAYRSSLISAGCAIQTLSLVSQAHGIQGCVAGGGNSELFSQCVGEPESQIASIAEFGYA